MLRKPSPNVQAVTRGTMSVDVNIESMAWVSKVYLSLIADKAVEEMAEAVSARITKSTTISSLCSGFSNFLVRPSTTIFQSS